MLEIPTNQYIDSLDGRNSDMLSVYAMGLAYDALSNVRIGKQNGFVV